MDFTREPIIETIITPKEGYKLVIRSSTNTSQEEYFVDAVEMVTFGHALFFRSLERPKAFLVPVSDYEVVEVREARMVLKNAGLDRSIKIGGGREANLKNHRETEKTEISAPDEIDASLHSQENDNRNLIENPLSTEATADTRNDKKKDRRRHYRKRKGKDDLDENGKKIPQENSTPSLEEEKVNLSDEDLKEAGEIPSIIAPSVLSALLQPPPTLISETINRYRQNEMFKNAFYLTEEEQYKPHDKVQELLNEDEEESIPSLQEPTFVTDEQVPESEEHLEELSFSTDESDHFSDPIHESENSDSTEAVENFDLKNKSEDFHLLNENEETKNEEEIAVEDQDKTDFSAEHTHQENIESALPLYAEEDTSELSTNFPEEHQPLEKDFTSEEDPISEEKKEEIVEDHSSSQPEETV